MKRTLFDKVWDSHLVLPETAEHPALVYIDLHLLHEVTSPQAFRRLHESGLRVRRPDRCLATLDHATPTTALVDGSWPGIDRQAEEQIDALVRNCEASGIVTHGIGSPERGIVHVMGPELGATLARKHDCLWGFSHGDSRRLRRAGIRNRHHGGCSCAGESVFAAAQAQDAFQSNCGASRGLEPESKDLILCILAALGPDGGTGHVIEYRGEAIQSLDMEGRMTLCNMSIEAGARAGMIAPDSTTWSWLEGRPMTPQGRDWERLLEIGESLRSDDEAHFDRSIQVNVNGLEPHVTWGTTPSMGGPITGEVPEPEDEDAEAALAYMGMNSGDPLLGQRIDEVFVGSCTNGRLGDLRRVAGVLKGRRIAPGLRMLVVPGSERVKSQAESEGIDRIVTRAGAEWREPGCSMCIAMNGDRAGAGRYVLSTSNRNFRGRQGPGARTMLAGAATAAASAVAGCLADPRDLEQLDD